MAKNKTSESLYSLIEKILKNKIFSVCELERYYKITILGIRFSFSKKRDIYKASQLIRNNQRKVLQILSEEIKTRKLKVGFLVVDNQKWNAESLYKIFEKSLHFDPYIVVSQLHNIHLGIEKNRQGIEENIKFFENLGLNVICGYNLKKREYIDLETLGFDIIFYSSPWAEEFSETQWIKNTSKHALLCYIPYAIAESPSSMKHNKLFFESIFKQYIVDKKILKDYHKVIKKNRKSIIVTGHTKLDCFLKPFEKSKFEKPSIIYAPHFTIGQRFFSTGTFDWSGMYILDYAKKHPEYHWIFKPHPLLKSEFVRTNFMSEENINNYFSEWAKLGTVYEYGNYFDIFRNSFALITDSASFLLEYYPTQKPVIRLMSKTYTYNNALTEMVAGNYYLAHNLEELESSLKLVLEDKKDPMKEKRLKFLELFQPCKNSAAENIFKDLEAELEIK